MFEFFVALAITAGLMAWIGYHAMTDRDGLKTEPDERLAHLEKKVADLEKRVGNI